MSINGIQFKIIKHIGVFGKSESGWTKEVNIISWNNRGAKIDVRAWAPDKSKSSKMGTMSVQEAMRLGELLIGLDDGMVDYDGNF